MPSLQDSAAGAKLKLSDMGLPDFKMPDFKMPDFEMPDFEMPDVNLDNILGTLKETGDANPRLVKALLGGLGTAAVGGGLTAMSKRRNEDPAERRKRILKNALGAGAAGAAATGLADYGWGELKTVDPGGDDPVVSNLQKITGIGGAGAGLGVSRIASRGDMIRSRTSMLDKMYSYLDHQKEITKDTGGLVGPRRDIHQAISYLYPNKSTGGEKILDKNFFSKLLGEHNSEPVLRSAVTAGKTPLPGGGNIFESIARAAGADKELRAGGYIRPANISADMPFKDKAKEILRLAKDTAQRSADRTIGIQPGRRLASGGRIAGGALIPLLLLQKLQSNPELSENTLKEFKDLAGNPQGQLF